MPAGLQIVGSGGAVQIDQDFRNFVLYSKETVVINTLSNPSSQFGNTYRGSGTVPTDRPFFVAVRGSNVAIGRVLNGVVDVFSKNQGNSVTVYVFAPAPTGASSTTTGLLVYNAAGQVVYDSSLKYMKVVSVDTVPDLDVSATDSMSSLPSGTYAVAITHSRWGAVTAFTPGLGDYLARSIDFYTTSSTGWSLTNLYFMQIPVTLNGNENYENRLRAFTGQQILTLDVSGL